MKSVYSGLCSHLVSDLGAHRREQLWDDGPLLHHVHADLLLTHRLAQPLTHHLRGGEAAAVRKHHHYWTGLLGTWQLHLQNIPQGDQTKKRDKTTKSSNSTKNRNKILCGSFFTFSKETQNYQKGTLKSQIDTKCPQKSKTTIKTQSNC